MLRTLSLLMLALTSILGAAEVRAQEPRQDVAILLSLPHGLERLGPEERARLERLKAAPGLAVQALTQAYQGRDLPALEGEERLRFERAVTLLGALGGVEARTLLAAWFTTLDAAGAGDPSGARVRMARSARTLTLQALATNPDAAVSQRVLDTFVAADDAQRAGDLQYLARVGRGDASVIAAFEARLAEPTITRDLAARRALLVMRSGLLPATPPTTPAAILDRLLDLPLDAVTPLPEDQALIERVVADPGTFVPLISQRVSAQTAATLTTEPGRTRFMSAVWLAGRLPSERAAPALASAFLHVDEILYTQLVGRQVLLALRQAALVAHGPRCPDAVGERVATRLPQGPVAWRPSALDWLGRVCVKNAAVRARIDGLRRGALAEDPAVRALWRTMERSP